MARQKLGQHFLLSGKVLRRIAAAACDAGVPLTVEIGPGKGALTRCLLQHSARVVAIELDRDLAEHLRRSFADEPRLQVVEGDALEVDWAAWGRGALAGNLPYYAATAIISKYVRSPGGLGPAVFLIQKEVAERITAVPGTREYGYFSVECQLLARAELLFTVPPGAFRPPPKVDSAVICLTPRENAGREASGDGFLRFVSLCFRQKRKTLRNNLVGAFPRELLDQRPEMSQRAEQLSVSALVDLYRALTAG
ncbi:MAG: 16S rRNA (adenine(1518)-N(6)/adenine(1519)-N(6))-dimethyltransferase RsmA [Bryobacteraceae bacterium]